MILEYPIVYQALYLLCFFSFLRLSNILPHSVNTFDITRQLCRGDLSFSPHNVILIKWSKTMQDRQSVSTITIPALGCSPLCPVTALTAMCRAFPATSNQPLFLYSRQGSFLPLTDSMARKQLKKFPTLLQFSKHFTFHDFRRGATWAFRPKRLGLVMQCGDTYNFPLQLPPLPLLHSLLTFMPSPYFYWGLGGKLLCLLLIFHHLFSNITYRF